MALRFNCGSTQGKELSFETAATRKYHKQIQYEPLRVWWLQSKE